MTPKRIFLFLTAALFIFLGLYSWNRKTDYLDAAADVTGLETTGLVLKPYHWIVSEIEEVWNNYLDLVDVRSENDALRAELNKKQELIDRLTENNEELERLRKLFQFSERLEWAKVGAHVIGRRMGPLAVLESVMLDKGFTNGALPGTPVVTYRGAAGKVLRASAHSSTVMLLTNPGFRIAVVSQRKRVPAILSGGGPGAPLEIKYIPTHAEILPGEILFSSGVDGGFPKGVPVAVVTSVNPPIGNPFLAVTAKPLAEIDRMEEVLLLQRPLRDISSAEVHALQEQIETVVNMMGQE